MAAEEEQELDLGNSDVCTKYREAGRIANLAMQGIKTMIKDGASVYEICSFGDTVINQACAGIYQKKVKGEAVEKGVAFPTCVSVNEVVCHNCPLSSDPPQALKDGDLVKIDTGVHVDGFIVVVSDTIKCGAALTAEKPLEKGPEADLFAAAHVMSEVATKMIKPGKTNQEVTEAWEEIATAYGVNMMEGTLGHQMKRFVIDGNKVIIGKRDKQMMVDSVDFEVNEVYSVDICLSTGDGKPKLSEMRTTVFKRAVDKTYRLKMKASRYLFNEVNSKHPTLPFSLRAFDDEKSARMGVVECQKHDLVVPYPVLFEKDGSLVVHVKFTLLLLPSGTVRVSGQAIDPALYPSDVVLPEATQAVLAQSSKNKKKKNKKKKEGADSGDGEAAEAAAE